LGIPELRKAAFTCPHCEVYSTTKPIPVAKVIYQPRRIQSLINPSNYDAEVGAAHFVKWYDLDELAITRCDACDGVVLWLGGDLVWPVSAGIRPAERMPEDVQKPFLEAQSIAGASPWAACALLRIALERLVDHLGGEGKNLYDRIENLKLPADEMPIWDAVRKLGNDAAHEGLFPYNSEEHAEVPAVISRFINLLVERHIGSVGEAADILEALKSAKKES
jgi:hypothetical protein